MKVPELRSAFAVGFCILFAFIGTFTYVNFILVAPPLGVGMMTLGFIYFVFLPSIVTTPLDGCWQRRSDVNRRCGAASAVLGLPLPVVPSLPAVSAGMVLVAFGTFFAQALATGFVSLAANQIAPLPVVSI